MISKRPLAIIGIQVHPAESELQQSNTVVKDFLPVAETSTGRRPARNIWAESIRPFFVLLVCSLLMCPSVFQSYAAIVKYLREPKTIEVYLEDFTTQEAPWITICPSPQFNFPIMEEYAARLYENRGASLSYVPFYHYLSDAISDQAEFTFDKITRYPDLLNMTLDGFVNSVATPIWANLSVCNVRSLTSTDSPVPSTCEFMDASLDYDAEDSRPYISMERSELMTFKVDNGTWESNIYLHQRNRLKICSTFQHNFENVPRVEFDIRFSHSLIKDHFIVTNNTNILEKRQWFPTYDVYLTQPNEKLDIYNGIYGKSPTFHLPMGDWIEVEVSAEMKYKSLPTKEQPCLEEPNEILDANECVTKCFEASLFKEKGKHCRLPGYRNKTLFPAYQSVDACTDRAGYRRLTEVIEKNSDDTTRSLGIQQQCIELCSARPCTKLQYSWKYVKHDPSDLARLSRNYTDAWSFQHRRMKSYMSDSTGMKLVYRLASARVFEQIRSYDMWAFVGEIGGTWGLFLGLSFLQVVAALENVAITFVQKLGKYLVHVPATSS